MSKTDIYDIKDLLYDALKADHRVTKVEMDEVNIRVTTEDDDTFLIMLQD